MPHFMHKGMVIRGTEKTSPVRRQNPRVKFVVGIKSSTAVVVRMDKDSTTLIVKSLANSEPLLMKIGGTSCKKKQAPLILLL
jgi:hypothetical protein